ncbi:MAG: peptidyl-prolyl cis-trans isomerase [Eubacterium sp.]|nr:peptidyl-prolyl cis-trans isomerase [Eubacterium sp.]
MILCLCVGLGGCRRVVISTDMTGSELFRVNGEVCSVKEAKLYLTTLRNEYKNFYGIDLWESTGSSASGDAELLEYIADKTMYRLQNVFCMYLLACENEIELSEEDLTLINQAATSYVSSLTEEERDFLDVTVDDVEEYYTRFAYAQAIFEEITGEVDLEISDDEARVCVAQIIYTTDAEKAQAASKSLSSGNEFSSVASTYSELSSVSANVSRGDFPDNVVEELFSLAEGESSGCITAEDGYYFVKCISRIDEELTELNREEILTETYEETFDDAYDDYVSGLSFTINDSAWEELLELDSDDVTTTSFFSEYNAVFSEE